MSTPLNSRPGRETAWWEGFEPRWLLRSHSSPSGDSPSGSKPDARQVGCFSGCFRAAFYNHALSHFAKLGALRSA
jgi:hypothetical protein